MTSALIFLGLLIATAVFIAAVTPNLDTETRVEDQAAADHFQRYLNEDGPDFYDM